MSSEKEYKRLYRRTRELRWVLDPVYMIPFRLNRKFFPLYLEELRQCHHLAFPHRRNICLEELPEVLVEHVQEKFRRKMLAYLKARVEERLRIERLLDELAANVELRATGSELRVLETLYSSTFLSSNRPERYARAHLEILAEVLCEHGFSTEIRVQDGRFELWSNAEEWQLDVLNRCWTTLERAAAYWRKGVNPAVYMPDLSPEVLDRALWKAQELSCSIS